MWHNLSGLSNVSPSYFSLITRDRYHNKVRDTHTIPSPGQVQAFADPSNASVCNATQGSSRRLTWMGPAWQSKETPRCSCSVCGCEIVFRLRPQLQRRSLTTAGNKAMTQRPQYYGISIISRNHTPCSEHSTHRIGQLPLEC